MSAGGPQTTLGPVGSICFQAHSQDCWQDPVSHGLLDRGPQILDSPWPKSTLGSSARGPLHRAAHSLAAGFPEGVEAKEVSKKEASLYKPISEVTTDYFPCVRFTAVLYACEVAEQRGSWGVTQDQEPQPAGTTDSC